MRHLKHILCSMILFPFFMVSCEKEEVTPAPIANFTMDKTEAETGETITFTNSSENATTYSWDFGDGNTSTDENPTHSYSSDGTYTVTLTATGDGGENSTSKTITIAYPSPVANFTMDKTEAETGETITFTNSSENATTYSWDFGDGNTSTDENPTHSYSSDGTYTVTLTATGDGGENSTSKTVEITKPSLIGTWNIESCKYDGNQITGVSGWINFKDETDYSARFDYGDEYGSASADYTVVNGTELESNIPEGIILFGSSFGLGTWSTKILCTGDNFLKFGATAILHTAVYGNVEYKIENEKLILKSPDSKTEITYIME